MAATAAAPENREVVVDELAAAIGQDRRTTGQALSLLLAVLGGGPSDAAIVRCHATADWGVIASGWITFLVVTTENPVPKTLRVERCLQNPASGVVETGRRASGKVVLSR